VGESRVAEISLRMTYDPDADAAFIYVSDPTERGGEASSTVLDKFTPSASVIASFDAKDRLLGIETLGASRLLRPDILPD
jgi:uncharacterized protein YuzE